MTPDGSPPRDGDGAGADAGDGVGDAAGDGGDDASDGGPLGVVLAAGRGTRFGATKQLAELDGRPLVLHAVEVLADAGLPVLVVVGHDGARVGEVLPDRIGGRPVRVVHNPDPDRGQGSSLAEAARAAGPRPLVVVLADQPGLLVGDVVRVRSALRDGAVAARIVHPDGPGHPVGLSAALHADLEDLRGETAGRDLLARVEVVELVADRPRPRDVDTPADLARVVAAGDDGPAGS